MRTKAIILSVAFSVVAAISTNAQVYSQNAVGYYTLDLGPEFTMIANQLNNGDNVLDTILPAGVPDGTRILKWDNAAQMFAQPDTFFNGVGWLDALFAPSTTTLVPGEGAFISLPPGTSASVTMVGEVPQGDFTAPVEQNFQILSQLTPQALAVDAVGNELPAGDGDIILFWDPVAQAYAQPMTYFAALSGWLDSLFAPVSPTPAIGEAFFLNRAPANGTDTWQRTFSVNP